MNAPRVRVVRRPVHGVLLLDKPLGLSSNDALQKAKWLLRAEKAGHTGTLDPLATGVLPLCFGAATKFSALQLDAVKTYEATVVFGIKTSTGDAEGEVISERKVNFLPPDLERVRKQFLGNQRQIPPMHSALKRDGKPLYAYAREGIELEREARDIEIYNLVFMPFEPLSHTAPAQAAIKMIVTVSKGTYIRTLGEDIGEALGCGAHLSSLRRTDTGGLSVDKAFTLAQLEAMQEAERVSAVQPVDSLLAGHQAVTLDNDNAGRFLSGMRRRTALPDNENVVVYADSVGGNPRALLGSAHIKAGELIPTRLLSPIEVSQIFAQAHSSSALQNAAPSSPQAASLCAPASPVLV
jgi:tRNA pseudouridine55 synthase